MARLFDWHQRLTGYVSGIATQPFSPGVLDCALFAAGAVDAMTGKNYAKKWRGYKTLKGGYKALKKAGFNDHIALAASILEEIKPAFASAGDIAVVDENALGVVQGSMIYVVGPDGLGMVPMSRATKFFRV